jgi:CheY-like chemotaxis protein
MLNDVAQGKAAGFSQYLGKPIAQSVLIETIDQVLGLKA